MSEHCYHVGGRLESADLVQGDVKMWKGTYLWVPPFKP